MCPTAIHYQLATVVGRWPFDRGAQARHKPEPKPHLKAHTKAPVDPLMAKTLLPLATWAPMNTVPSLPMAGELTT